MDVLLFLIGLFLYFLPSIIGRNKRNSGGIFVLNLLAGWTFIGWIVALVWALVNDPLLPPIVIQQPSTIDAPAAVCASCGRYSAPGSRFCSSCGRMLTSAS
jgi:Superinfection immunity protein